MSWEGLPDLAGEVRQTSRAVHSEGVVHGDERDDNMLWNPERRRVMLINFERSYVLPIAKHKQLLKLSGRKRKQLAEEKRMLLDSRLHH
jgi:Ser/Thr protein kinase RdoA (MazF antagonist)